MELTKNVYRAMVQAVVNKAAGLDIVGTRNCYNVDEGAKSGAMENMIGMIIELESHLRVLKRRLINSLPAEVKAVYMLSNAAVIEAATEAKALNNPIS